jgi:hypothetical protein
MVVADKPIAYAGIEPRTLWAAGRRRNRPRRTQKPYQASCVAKYRFQKSSFPEDVTRIGP